jgi:CTP:phosphocholine cytidylyltransferase-like protein
VSRPIALSFSEFEILEFLLRMGKKSTIELNQALPILSDSDLIDSVKSLIDKNLVLLSGEKIVTLPAAKHALEPYRVKRAVILAAGRGLRMQPATDTAPKPMMKINDKRLIETQLDALLAAGITDITIVRGYMGKAFDELLVEYPSINFIDNPDWSTTEAIVSTLLAVDLLSDAYLIEGDLYISNPDVIRTYEYRSSYCGAPGLVNSDWYYCADNDGLIEKLTFGDSLSACTNPHRFIGIMFWAPEHSNKIRTDLISATQNPENKHRFIESVPFDPRSNNYDIYARPLQANEVIEVDTYKEIQNLRSQVKELPN